MKNTLRIVLAAAVLTSFAPVAQATPGSGEPMPPVNEIVTVTAGKLLHFFLSVIGL